MGLLHMGFVTIYLSEPLTRGLTTGAAVHVLTSQIKFILGIKSQSYTGPLKLIYVSTIQFIVYCLARKVVCNNNNNTNEIISFVPMSLDNLSPVNND